MLHRLLVPERMPRRKVVSGRVERFIHLTSGMTQTLHERDDRGERKANHRSPILARRKGKECSPVAL